MYNLEFSYLSVRQTVALAPIDYNHIQVFVVEKVGLHLQHPWRKVVVVDKAVHNNFGSVLAVKI